MARIGTIFPPKFFGSQSPDEDKILRATLNSDTRKMHVTVEISEESVMNSVFSYQSGAWRQVVYEATRAAKKEYSHFIPLMVMEQLLESLVGQKVVNITPQMEKKFAQYQKLKRLALNPGTKGEGQTAARQALRILTTVLEEAM